MLSKCAYMASISHTEPKPLHTYVRIWQDEIMPQLANRWKPITPADLDSGVLTSISRGAQAAGVTADALVTVDGAEHSRRARVGLPHVTSLRLLDTVMDFPLLTPVRMCDVGARSQEVIREAPRGVFVRDDLVVTRLLSPPVTVVAALVLGASWRRVISRASTFAPFCQQVMLLERRPRDVSTLIWEADLAGIGVWIRSGGETVEVLRPSVFNRRRWKAAGWRFQERAYAAWLRSMPRTGLSRGYAGHPSRTGTGGCCRPVLELPAT